jgi:hypothetical protein
MPPPLAATIMSPAISAAASTTAGADLPIAAWLDAAVYQITHHQEVTKLM